MLHTYMVRVAIYGDQIDLNMADRTGFEPATSGVTGRHSNQLNYRSVECYLNSALMVGAEGVEPPTFAL